MFYAYIKSGNDSIAKAEKELFHSLDKTYDLYFYIMEFLIQILRYAEGSIELAKQKKIPTYEDLNPNTKFINNKVLKLIDNNEFYNNTITTRKVNWSQNPEIIKKFYKYLVETKLYKDYVGLKNPSYDDDLEFVSTLLNKELIINLDLYQILEEVNIYWNDDIEFVIGMISKTIKKININKNEFKLILFKLFKNDEDIAFTKTLFRKAIVNYNDYLKLIDEYTENWDVERIAFMDIIIISLAITEITEFSSIPIKVSFNEYLEISKQYSTQNSSGFVNGVLDNIIQRLKTEKKIVKTGRGLIGEN